jgi:very-long-chain (3R)-3-hydroxyacyl-CoA dehydratase
MADQTKKPARQPSPLKNGYLILYNFASAIAWTVVLGRTLVLLHLGRPGAVYPSVGEWTKWTQTMAVVEVLHSLLGAHTHSHSHSHSHRPQN